MCRIGSMGMNKLEPMEVIRTEMGTWSHPVYINQLCEMIGDKEYITKDEWDNFRKELNIDTVTFWMESTINSDDWETMMDAGDITKWDPIAPNGFFLVDINFSEDDAYAIFARNNRNSELT